VSTPTTIRRRQPIQQIGQNFMKISLSDLAGLNRMEENEKSADDIHAIMLRRNIGVSDHHYASNRSLNKINKQKDNTKKTEAKHVRTYSASAAFCSPVVNVRSDRVDITTVDEQAVVDEDTFPPSPTRRQAPPPPTTVTHLKINQHRKPPIVAPKPTKLGKSYSSASIIVNHGNASLESQQHKRAVSLKEKATDENRTQSLPTTPNKVIFMPKQDMFYTPTQQKRGGGGAATEAKKRSSVHRSNQNLEEIGARHMHQQKSVSIRSLPEASDERGSYSVPSEERPNPRVNSTTYTTRFDGTKTWDVSLTQHQPLINQKSTMV